MPPTPQFCWPLLKQRTGVDVVIKHENHTPTGAFKVRGGLVYVDRLKRERPDVKGVITATRGNHGQSLAFACARARHSLHGRGAVRQFGREECRHEGVRRRTDRAWPRLRRGARARRDRSPAERGYEYGKSFDARSGARRCDLRVRAVHRRAGARCGLCADRARLGHLRHDRGARCAWPQGARHRRGLGSRQHLSALARCRPRGADQLGH